jgi:hypothetical protein
LVYNRKLYAIRPDGIDIYQIQKRWLL